MVVGIDLGTTNSLVAYWDGQQPRIIPSAFGQNVTPSAVGVDDSGELLIGAIARERMVTHPSLTTAAFKRFMGTAMTVELGRHTMTPVELSALVLKSLKADAEHELGQPVDEAVISVPAYFNDSQRKATLQAAKLAGLDVLRLISEPTAAALFHGLHQQEDETCFLVLDLGGGTFDVSVLELFEGVMEVRAVAGDNSLGGDDFTALLAEMFRKKTGLPESDLEPGLSAVIRRQAEQAKCALSQSDSAEMTVIREQQPLSLCVTRTDFEAVCKPLLQRIRAPIERALSDTRLRPQDFDAIVLIGGSTRMPAIRSMAARMFGRLPNCDNDPDETVAKGAAIQAALLARDAALEEFVLTDVCPYSLGTGVMVDLSGGTREYGIFHPMIERNTAIPVSKVASFMTVARNQEKLYFGVYQGESRKVQNNVKIGEIEVDVPPGEPGAQSVDLRFTYDVNGILEVEALALSTGDQKRVVIQNSAGWLTQEEIEEKLEAIRNLKIHPRDRAENRLLLARGERLFEESIGGRRREVERLIERLINLLATQDEEKIKRGVVDFKSAFDRLEQRLDY